VPYRADHDAGHDTPENLQARKERLSREAELLEAQYNQLKAMRSELAQARDAAVAR
jgi:prefoldin subunit 5